MEINYFENATQSKSDKKIILSDYFDAIKNGKWQDAVLHYRTCKNEDERKKIKKNKTAGVTVSGLFKETRASANIETHSGLLCIDCDAKENPDILEKRDVLGTDKYVYAFHTSLSGYGLAIYFKINPLKHLDSYLALEKYLADNYHIISDKACKDVSRMRFVSYDPDLFLNPKALKFTQYLEKKQTETFNFNPIYAKSDIDYCVNQLIDKSIDITASYHDWLKVGFAFVNEFGENGRQYFHRVSQVNHTYNRQKTDTKYDNLLRSKSDGVKISSFFWLCKQSGINIKQEKTKNIENVSSLRKKMVGKAGGIETIEKAKENSIKYLTEIEKLNIEEVSEIVNRVFDNKENETIDTESDITQIYQYINTLEPKYNLITKKAEINGIEITDKKLNSIFLNCKEMFPKIKLSRDLISYILESDRIPEYNPILNFFNKNKHLKPKGNIDKLLDCFTIPEDDYSYYAGLFMRKWLLSIISSANGTYSLLILALIGDQATNKTNFFRNLLPTELLGYYAESKLDKGVDDEILMSQKLIILDDEYGGKSKKEANKLKDLSSKQKFTQRRSYGRYHENFDRLAVLCGTSNEDDIINDPTGNRRIIPIKVLNIDIEKFKSIDKTELFMELYWEWRQTGDSWMLTKEEIKILNEKTTQFTEITIEEDLINKHFKPAQWNDFDAVFMTTTQMLTYCENFLSKQRLNIKKFSQVLKKLNFNRMQKKNIGYGFYVRKIIED